MQASSEDEDQRFVKSVCGELMNWLKSHCCVCILLRTLTLSQ